MLYCGGTIFEESIDEPLIVEHNNMSEDPVRGLQKSCGSSENLTGQSSFTLVYDGKSESSTMCRSDIIGKYKVSPFLYKHLLLKSKRTKDAPVSSSGRL